MSAKFQLSRDSPALYITVVAKDRLPVFKSDAIKQVQKVNYIRLNPVRAGLVERAIDYRWPSAKIWQRIPSDDEPLTVDLDRIEWRRA